LQEFNVSTSTAALTLSSPVLFSGAAEAKLIFTDVLLIPLLPHPEALLHQAPHSSLAAPEQGHAGAENFGVDGMIFPLYLAFNGSD
jgi:hypothetical protein